MSYTLLQIVCVMMVWVSVHFWKPIKTISWWPALLIFALFAGGWGQAALLAFCGSVLALSLQELNRLGGEDRGDKLSVILPAIAFATIVVIPDFSVPNPVFVAWLLSLTIGRGLFDQHRERRRVSGKISPFNRLNAAKPLHWWLSHIMRSNQPILRQISDGV